WMLPRASGEEHVRTPPPVPTDMIQSAIYTPDLKRLIGGGRNDQGHGRLIAWDLSTRQPDKPIDLEEGALSKVAISPDGKLLATATAHGRLILWDISTWLRGPALEANDGGISSLAFSPDGKTLATGGGDHNKVGTIILWNCKEQKPLRDPLRANER